MNLGKVFKQERERLNVSQREMATRLNISPVALWKIEAGRTRPKWTTINRFIAEAHLPVAFFFHEAFDLEDYICP